MYNSTFSGFFFTGGMSLNHPPVDQTPSYLHHTAVISMQSEASKNKFPNTSSSKHTANTITPTYTHTALASDDRDKTFLSFQVVLSKWLKDLLSDLSVVPLTFFLLLPSLSPHAVFSKDCVTESTESCIICVSTHMCPCTGTYVPCSYGSRQRGL